MAGTARLVLFCLVALVPSIGFAHSEGHTHAGFVDGLAHPFGGIDHLLVALAIGMASVAGSGRIRLLVPAIAILGLTIGGIIGVSGLTNGPFETVMALTVIAMGVLVASRMSLVSVLAAGIAMIAGLHGWTHGLAGGIMADTTPYLLGTMLTTLGLIGAGIAIAYGGTAGGASRWMVHRVAGAGTTACGLVLFAVTVFA